jgi:hypothetical protein
MSVIQVTRQTLLDAFKAWQAYPAAFAHLSETQKADFLHKQGYASFHALLSHIVAWWEEAFGIMDDIMAGREHLRPPKQYDLDTFNAAAVERFNNWSEADLLAHYEVMRRKLLLLVSNLNEEQLQIKRFHNWLHAVVLEHAEEHAIQE